MTAIAQALRSGHSTQNILRYLSQQNPELAQTISTALEAGHSIDHVVNFISKNEKKLGRLIPEKTQRDNPFKKIQTNIHPSLQGAAKAAAITAGAVGGGMALSRAVPSILQKRSVANAASSVPMPSGSPQSLLPTNQNRMPPNNAGINGQSQSLSQQPPINPNVPNTPQAAQQPPLSNANAASIPEPTNIQQPKGFDTNIIRNGIAYKSQIDALIKSGNGPEEIEAYLKKFSPQSVKTIEKEGKGAFKDVVAQYMQEQLRDEAMQLEGSIPSAKTAPMQQEQPQLKEAEPLQEPIEQPKEQEKPKIEKNSVVSSPNGVGEVKEIRNGQAIVEVDGKLTKVKEEDLQPEPEEVKKAKIEFNLDDVPEDLRSAPLNEVYAPAHRKHVTIKYNSDIGKEKSKRYIFYKKDGSPVDENIIENLRVGSQLPITSGKSFWGGWSSDTQDSRGTVAYHELTKMAQKMGEEDDPSKPYWFEEEEEVFTHGYSKQAEKKLKEEERKFNEANKKPKKKRA